MPTPIITDGSTERVVDTPKVVLPAGEQPYSDDLATLSLDLLVDEQGYQRSGPNFLLHPGSG